MKWWNSRYVYPLILLSLLVSIGLQAVWLRQLYLSQKVQLKKDIEEAVSQSAIQTNYASLTEGRDWGSHFSEFFLSPQWLRMRQAFDDLKQKGLQSNFQYAFGTDSSRVDMRIVFINHPTIDTVRRADTIWNHESPEELQKMEARNIRAMDSTVRQHLVLLGIRSKTDYALYSYGADTLMAMTVSPTLYRQAAYHSGRYSFNFKSLHKYELIVQEINAAVLFRMRYYLLSSLLMVLLTGIAFYFLLRLIRNQRLYSEARIAFTSNMTHELKTPVATVAVALESITKYGLINEPEKLQAYLDISRQELQRLNLMIEKVLNLSQEEQAGHSAHRELYDVQSGLKEAIASMQVQLDNSGSVIHFSPCPEPCFVLGDPVHLMNVFYNLIDNAIKYAGPGLDLRISCHQRGELVEVSFADNGPGIARIYQDRIFERYFRIPAGGDIHTVKGSGLGLHYVRQVLEKHGGTISVRGERGKGSNFIIILPAAR
ncbi:MAG TPA: HAMP domain-containing sensor histidine kinase [Puia sp.]|nr:HAMP domain-containing sensor histidine kinase [Puia sp.]